MTKTHRIDPRMLEAKFRGSACHQEDRLLDTLVSLRRDVSSVASDVFSSYVASVISGKGSVLDDSGWPSSTEGNGLSSSCAIAIPRWLRLLDLEGAGLEVGDTRVVMIFREFIVS